MQFSYSLPTTIVCAVFLPKLAQHMLQTTQQPWFL